MTSLDRNIAMTQVEGHDIVTAEANTAIPLKGDFERMARRRYQQGQLLQRGKKRKVWVGRWREDTIMPDGTTRRLRRSEVLGTLKDLPTRRLAERALERRISEAKVNSLDYRPSPIAKFFDFANKWDEAVLSQHKPSTQSADRSRIRKHLIPDLGETLMKDLTAQRLQSYISTKARSMGPKSVKNLVALLRTMWIHAKAWGYVQHDPFGSLVLPELPLLDEPAFALQDMKDIIDAAEEPEKTLYWIMAELGDRAGEAFGLAVPNLLLDDGAVRISQSVWHGKIQTVKSKRGNRVVQISPQLVEHLRGYLQTWKHNPLNLLFATSKETPWDIDTVRKRKFHPLLRRLGMKRAGFHAFRHGNATIMDQLQVPMATRLNRLGQADARTALGYTHMMTKDGRCYAAYLGQQLSA